MTLAWADLFPELPQDENIKDEIITNNTKTMDMSGGWKVDLIVSFW